MVKTLVPVLFLLSSATVSAEVTPNALALSITPDKVSLCGGQATPVMRINCQIKVTTSQVLSIEIGRKTASGNAPIAWILNDKQYDLIKVDTQLSSRLTQTNWGAGRLSVSLDHPGRADLHTYYCSAAFISGSLRYSETTQTVGAEGLQFQVPSCSQSNVDGSVSHHVSTTHAQAGTCPDGQDDRPEALVLNYCRSPVVGQWNQGPKVTDICCKIPAYTPIATFVFGVYVEDEHGVSGVFLECIPNGFSMALQLCGHPPMIVNLTHNSGGGFVEDPDNYHIVLYNSLPPVG